MADTSSKVLCVDDQPDVLALLEQQLKENYTLSFARSGAEALSKLSSEGPFAVIIVDYTMPSMDGVTLLREIRQRAPDTVLMMLTAHADVSVAVAALHEGDISRFLRKPWDLNLLNKYIEDGIRQHRLVVSERKMASAMERLNRKLKKKVHELEEANHLLHHWVEFSPAVIYHSVRHEKALVPTYVSANIGMLLGYAVDDALSDASFWVARLHPEDQARAVADIERALVDRSRIHCIEYRFRHQNGEYRWIQDTFRVLPGRHRAPPEIVGAWMDISERKAREHEAFANDNTIPHSQVH